VNVKLSKFINVVGLHIFHDYTVALYIMNTEMCVNDKAQFTHRNIVSTLRVGCSGLHSLQGQGYFSSPSGPLDLGSSVLSNGYCRYLCGDKAAGA
jgi:hypothetical protein